VWRVVTFLHPCNGCVRSIAQYRVVSRVVSQVLRQFSASTSTSSGKLSTAALLINKYNKININEINVNVNVKVNINININKYQKIKLEKQVRV
jgi:hypothetical protein